MKKVILFLLIWLIIFPLFVGADSGMMNYGMMGCGMGNNLIWGGLFGLLYFIIVSFVFSLIFWFTYKWIIKKN